MTHLIRYPLIALPLTLMLAGCAGPQHIESTSRTPPPPRSAGTTKLTSSLVADRGDEPLVKIPSATDLQHDITLIQIRRHVQDNTAVMIDARSPEQFASSHVRGALNLPAGQIEAYMTGIWPNVASDQVVIIYCAGPSCGSGDMVYEYLAAQGFTHLRVFTPGWQALASARDLR